jgi:hypothetical protein
MTTATVEKQVPVDLDSNVPLTHVALEVFLHEKLDMPSAAIYETRAYISNLLLGRNQKPTMTDSMMAERMYQNHEFDRFWYYPEWTTHDDRSYTLHVRVVEREGHVPKAAAFGDLIFTVEWEGGMRGNCVLVSGWTRDIVSNFDGFRVFDDCQGFESNRCWPWVVRLPRDIRAWAGNASADYYEKFLAYAQELMTRKVAEEVMVKLAPHSTGGPGRPEKVRLIVQMHRGPVQLAGFTTVAEFNEVLTKEQQQ